MLIAQSSRVNEASGLLALAQLPSLRRSRMTRPSFVHTLPEDGNRSLGAPRVAPSAKKKINLSLREDYFFFPFGPAISSSSVIVLSPTPLTYNKV